MKKNKVWDKLLYINSDIVILEDYKNTTDKKNKKIYKKHTFFISKYETKKNCKKIIEIFFQIKIQNIYFVKHLNKNFLNFNKIIVEIN